MSRFQNSHDLDGGLVANFGIKATLEEIVSSVLFEFEVREAADPVNVASFKFGTRAHDREKCARSSDKIMRRIMSMIPKSVRVLPMDRALN